MALKPVTGGVLVPACSPCDAQDRFLETPFADMLEQGMREPLDGAGRLVGGLGRCHRIGQAMSQKGGERVEKDCFSSLSWAFWVDRRPPTKKQKVLPDPTP